MSVFSKRGTKRVRTLADGEIKKLIGLPELKYLDGNVSGSNVPHTTGAIWSLNEIPQGYTANQRAGDQIRLKSIQLRFDLRNNISNLAPIYVRLLVIRDTQSNGAVPSALSDVLATPSTPHTSFLNLSSTRGRFRVLRDKVIRLGPATSAASVPAGTIQMNASDESKFFGRILLKMNKLMDFTSSLGTSYKTGNILLCVASSEAAGNEANISWRVRVRWTDV